MKAQKNTADELEACRRAHAAEKQAAEELRQKIHEASLVRTPPQTPPREPSSDHASHSTAGRMRAAALKSLRTELEHARAALAEMRLRSDHTEESHVKALQHDLRHAAEECQELHDEVAKEKKLRAESEEALRMEQSVFAEAEMARLQNERRDEARRRASGGFDAVIDDEAEECEGDVVVVR